MRFSGGERGGEFIKGNKSMILVGGMILFWEGGRSPEWGGGGRDGTGSSPGDC